MRSRLLLSFLRVSRLGLPVFLIVFLAIMGFPGLGYANGTQPVAVSLRADKATVNYGDTVSFHVTVTDSTGSTIAPGGSVLLLDNERVVNEAVLTPGSPSVSSRTGYPPQTPPELGLRAVCLAKPDALDSASSCPVLEWGDYTFWALSYNDNRTSFGIVQYDGKGQFVNQLEKAGARYLYQIAVNPNAQTATFIGQSSASVTIEWGELKAANSNADIIVSNLTPGRHTFKAVYVPNDNVHADGMSGGLDINVNKIGSSLTVASSSASTVFEQPVTFTAQFVPTAGAVPSGGVIFYDDDKPIGEGALSANQANTVAAATYTTSSLQPGLHAIHAVYSGDANYLESVSLVLNQNVSKKQPTTTTIETSGAPPAMDSVTLAVYVKGAAGSAYVPDGVVEISDNDQIVRKELLNAEGNAVITLTSLSVGNHTIKASYTGSPVFEGSVSSPLTVPVVSWSEARMSGLGVLGAELSRPFDGSVMNYTAVVSHDTAGITLIPVIESSAAALEINGQPASANQASSPIPLREGMNVVHIKVTSGDRQTSSVYTLTVYRHPERSANMSDVVRQIASQFDINGDGVFDEADVRRILSQIPPLYVTPKG